jgi:hypothetical protein
MFWHLCSFWFCSFLQTALSSGGSGLSLISTGGLTRSLGWEEDDIDDVRLMYNMLWLALGSAFWGRYSIYIGVEDP